MADRRGHALAAGGVAVPTYDGSTAYVFEAPGDMPTVDAPLGLTQQTIDYDASGRLTDVTGTSGPYPIGVSIVRGSDGAPQALAGIDGARTTLLLDAAGHLTAVIDPAGHTTSIAYGDGGS